MALMAPRGIVAAAVSALVALDLESLGLPGGERLLSETLAVIAGTVVVYSLSARHVARGLGLALPKAQGVLIVGARQCARQVAEALDARGLEVLVLDSDRSDVQAAAALGLHVYRGSIASRGLVDQLDLTGIGTLVALSESDEVNVLAGVHFAPVFGRENIYHLAPRASASTSAEESSHSRSRGRVLFERALTFDELHWQLLSGGEICARLVGPDTDAVASTDAVSGDDATPAVIPMFYLRGDTLEVCSTDVRSLPVAGDLVIALTTATPSPRLRQAG